MISVNQTHKNIVLLNHVCQQDGDPSSHPYIFKVADEVEH